MDCHLITHHQSYVITRVVFLPPSLKGNLLDSRTRSTRIVGSMPKETSIPTPRSPLFFSVDGPPPAAEERRKLDLIEERLRAVEGFDDYLFTDMTDLCLVLDVIIPPKFKVPDFDRYKGTTCPKNHLKMYCRKMGANSKDEKLLMHFFQDSLAGAAVVWYTNLEASRVRTGRI